MKFPFPRIIFLPSHNPVPDFLSVRCTWLSWMLSSNSLWECYFGISFILCGFFTRRLQQSNADACRSLLSPRPIFLNKTHSFYIHCLFQWCLTSAACRAYFMPSFFLPGPDSHSQVARSFCNHKSHSKFNHKLNRWNRLRPWGLIQSCGNSAGVEWSPWLSRTKLWLQAAVSIRGRHCFLPMALNHTDCAV